MDYSKTKIYKIESALGDKVYIGSTINKYLSQRFQLHKSEYKRWKKRTAHKITSYELFDLYGVENCNIVLIEEYPCLSKDAKNAREGHCIKTMPCVNKYVAGRTLKENYQDKKEQKIEYQKQYNKDNIIKYTEYQKAYREKMKAKKIELVNEDAGDIII